MLGVLWICGAIRVSEGPRRCVKSDLCDRRLPRAEIKIFCWNCKCLSNNIPYIRKLMDGGSNILVLSEHWLWPYELHRLGEIHDDFEAFGNADS